MLAVLLMRSAPIASSPLPDGDFEIAIICALPLEASTVGALFDKQWDDQSYGKVQIDSNV